MTTRRVVITGMGAVTSIGIGVKEFGEALKNGRSGVSKITSFDTEGYENTYGCEVRNFLPENWILNIDKNIGRSTQFSVAAARMAVEDSGIELQKAKMDCGVVIGTTDGEPQVIADATQKWVSEDLSKTQTKDIRNAMAHCISYNISQELELEGESLTISTACAAGNYAIGHAYDLIRSGSMDFMLCGGADSINRKTFSGFYRMGTIAPEVCQPFDADRKGILTGEGAGVMFIESLESAQKRGAEIYAEILGYGLNCDAYHMVAPNPESIANCMKLAHKNSGIDYHQVDYISAHGTGTVANDINETKAIKQVFENTPPPTSSMKSMLGHTMGAASALASIGCAIALKDGFIPPTINWNRKDPECDLDCVPNVSREAKLTIAQNNAFAFGGNNAIVLYKRWG